MIYAKLDVCIATHPKFVAAGDAAVGYWCAALAYSCGHQLDGAIPSQIVGLILAVGPESGRVRCERLVEIGLFKRSGDGYAIVKFAEKNATKAQIEAKQRESAERVAKFRKAHRNAAASDGEVSVGNALPLTAPESVVPGSGSNSLSGSRSKSEDLRSDARAGDAATRLRRSVIPPGLQLTTEARAVAESVGVQDIDGEWIKFVAHHRAHETLAVDFYALWPKWAVMGRNFQRRERERDARRAAAVRPPVPETPPAPYHGTSNRRRAELDIAAQLEARLAAGKLEASEKPNE